MAIFGWFKRTPWRKKQAGVFYQSVGTDVCLPAFCRFTHRVLDLKRYAAKPPLPKGRRPTYFSFQIETRCLGPSKKMLGIIDQIDCTKSVSRLPDKPESGLIDRFRTIFRKVFGLN